MSVAMCHLEVEGLSSGVVGIFLLWERLLGIMLKYPIVIDGGGGVPE